MSKDTDSKVVIVDSDSGELVRYAESESEAIRWSLDNLFDSNKPVTISLNYDQLPAGIIEMNGTDFSGFARLFNLVTLDSI